MKIMKIYRKLSNSHSGLNRILRKNFSSKNNFYEILGIPKGATQAEIKKAYAKLAREYHPDKNPDPSAKQKFTQINEAYSTLSDDKKRQVYDQTGMSGDEQKQYAASGFDPSGEGFDFNDFFGGGANKQGGFEGVFKDFEDLFGFEKGSQSRSKKGNDVIITLEIDFMDAVNGVTKDVSYRVKNTCSVCKGNKCKPGTTPTKCATCNGKGTVNFRQGPMQIQMGCQSCNSQGTFVKNPCTHCKGSGSEYTTMNQKVAIPKGINTGQNLRIVEKGNVGENSAKNGDLILKVVVRPDPFFRREDYDIYTEHLLSISQAVLGDQIEVRTLSGKRKVTVQPGSVHGSKVKLQGEGITKLDQNSNAKGDHYVVFSVNIPKQLTPEQRQIFESLRAIEEKKANASSSASGDQGQSEETKKEGFFKSFEKIFHKE